MNNNALYIVLVFVVVVGAVFLISEGIFNPVLLDEGLGASFFRNFFGVRVGYYDENDIYACRADSDCMAIQLNCCNCANGGYTTAINKMAKNYWTRTNLSNCSNVRCSAVAHFCSWNAGCENHRCVLR